MDGFDRPPYPDSSHGERAHFRNGLRSSLQRRRECWPRRAPGLRCKFRASAVAKAALRTRANHAEFSPASPAGESPPPIPWTVRRRGGDTERFTGAVVGAPS